MTQIVDVMDTDEQKWPWLVERLYDFMKEGSVLVFVSTKNSAEELQVRLNNIPDYTGKGTHLKLWWNQRQIFPNLVISHSLFLTVKFFSGGNSRR